MKRLAISIAIVMVLGLAGCATTTEHAGLAQQHAQLPGVDYDKVTAQNESAMRHGARLQWVHYPLLPPDNGKNGG